MSTVEYGVHWLSFTVRGTEEDALNLHDNLFRELFGDVQDQKHGGRSYRRIWQGLLAYKIYALPTSIGEHFHVEIPGTACEQMKWSHFLDLGSYLEENFHDRYNFTRLDFAFDHVRFTPNDAFEAIKNNEIRSLAKRSTLNINSSPLLEKKNGELGTNTVYFGSKESTRYIRIYDMRGFTRIEFVVKEDRATVFAQELLSSQSQDDWFEIGISYLRDFIDFYHPWWDEFTNGVGRAYLTISNPANVSLEKSRRWFLNQVAPVYSMLVEVLPPGDLKMIELLGRKRRKDKYDLIIENAGGYPGRELPVRKGSQGGTSVSMEDQT